MKDTYICVHVMYYFFKGKKSNELVYQMLDEGYWCAVCRLCNATQHWR